MRWRWFGLAFAILAVDQTSKWWLLDVYRLGERGWVEILPFLNFVLVWNPGISFGLLPVDSGVARWGLIILTGAIAVVVAVWLRRADRTLLALALALVLGGAVGNIIDRIRFGAVLDFIQVHAFGYSFYVFNVADAAISIGVALLIVDAILPARGRGPTVQSERQS